MFRQAFYYLTIKNNPIKNETVIQTMQLAKMKRLLRHAYETIPFYKTLYGKYNIKQQDINSLNDLNRLPIITKQMIRDAGNSIISKKHKVHSLLHYKTSGTTGIPLSLYRSKSSMDLLRASKFRTYRLNGFHPFMKTFYWRSTPQPKKISHLLRLNRDKRTERDIPLEDQVALLQKYQADVLYCNPNQLADVARFILDNKVHGIEPKLIFLESENLLPAVRSLIKECFHVDPVNIYGSREFGAIAWECKKRHGLHINADLLLIQVIDPLTNQEVKEGESGHVVITDLTNQATPFIRYDTEDIATATFRKCSCGITFPLLTNILGRDSEILTLPSGKKFQANVYFSILLREIETIEQYQVIITLRNTFVIRLKTHNNAKINEQDLKAKISDQCEGMQTEIQYVNSVEVFVRSSSGKFLDYIHESSPSN